MQLYKQQKKVIIPSFEEGHIKRGGVEVDKLEDEHFENKSIFIFGLSTVHFCWW